MDFTKLKYRPDKKGLMVDEYPELAKYKVFSNNDDLPPELTADFVLRFAILVWDKNSPGQDETDLKKRKAWALNYLLKTDGKVPDYINRMLQFEYKGVAPIIVTYLRICRNPLWSLYAAAEQKHSDLLMQMFVPRETPLEEKHLQDAINLNMQRLEDTKDKLTDYDKSSALSEAINEYMADENLKVIPEEYIVEYEQTGTVFRGVIV